MNLNVILGAMFGMVAVVGGPVGEEHVQAKFAEQLREKAVYVQDPTRPDDPSALTLEISAVDRQESAQRWQRYQQGVRYCGYYALALVGLGLLQVGGRGPLIGGIGFSLGTILYAIGMAAAAYFNMPTLQVGAPIGAMILIVGWGGLLLSALHRPGQPRLEGQ